MLYEFNLLVNGSIKLSNIQKELKNATNMVAIRLIVSHIRGCGVQGFGLFANIPVLQTVPHRAQAYCKFCLFKMCFTLNNN